MNGPDHTALRWMKFNLVGGIGIGVQLIVLTIFKGELHFNYLWATALAVEAAVIHNFLWHERFTWVDRTKANRASRMDTFLRFLKFNFTTGAFSILGNLALMKLFVDVAHRPYLAANGMAIAVCSIANFLVSDRFVFRSVDFRRHPLRTVEPYS